MAESWKSLFTRYWFNFYPVYRSTGGKILYVRHDWQEVKICLRLFWRTRNYVGTIFGGSIYSSVDPIYMLMLIKILGPTYIIWDKGAVIKFKKPGRSTLYATFLISDEEVALIKRELETQPSIDRIYHVDLVDENQVVHASIEKTIYIAKKREKTTSDENR